jgi:hypothetical protein
MCRLITVGVVALGLVTCGDGGEDRARPGLSSAEGNGILVVSYAPDSADTFAAVGHDSIVVLEWLRRATDDAGIPLELKEYPFGIMVEAIGPLRNGDGGYWLYEVNDGGVPEAASSHPVAAGDTVRFFFQ